MPRPPPPPFLRWLPALLVLLLAWIAVTLLFGRLSPSAWQAPHWLEGDPLEIYARVRIAAEQPRHALTHFTHIERLGAPLTADWAAYPVPDRLVFMLTGLLSHLTGLIAAVHLTGAGITSLNALAFFLCARWLRVRWEWAAALGLAFAFSSYNLRWGITLSLNQTFVLPPLVLLCARAARTGPPRGSTRAWSVLAAALGLWLGLANPYLAFFAGVIGGGTLLLCLLRRSPAPRRNPLLLFLGCLVLAFLLGNTTAIAAHLRGTTAQSLIRSANDLRVYALRPADWFVPPADHRWPALARLGHAYQAARSGPGEFFYNYLGWAGLAGLVLLLARTGRRLRQGRWQRLDPLLGLLWITAFGIAGGLNTVLGAAGLDLFRASSRIGVYALVWALLAAAGGLSRRTRSWPRTVSLLAAAGFACAAIWEQTPDLANRATSTRNLARWQAVQELTDRLERDLPPGASVFQLPAAPFPEAGPTRAMPDYEHLLPLLTSHHLHFSYGQLRSSPVQNWARQISRLPATDLVATLEKAGFALLWLDTRATDDGGTALARDLAAAGRAELPPVPAPLSVRLWRLHPADPATEPDWNDPRLHDPWDPLGAGPESPLVLSGWHDLEVNAGHRWRWAGRQAGLGLWHEGPPADRQLTFQLAGPPESVVVVRQEGREIWRGHPGPGLHTIRLTLTPGFNRLDWVLTGRTFRPGPHDPRNLGFMVENLSLSVP